MISRSWDYYGALSNFFDISFTLSLYFEDRNRISAVKSNRWNFHLTKDSSEQQGVGSCGVIKRELKYEPSQLCCVSVCPGCKDFWSPRGHIVEWGLSIYSDSGDKG